MIDACKEMGVIPLILNPLDGGLASGVYTATNPSGGEVGDAKFKFELLEKLQPLHSVQETVAERARTRVKREQRDMKDRYRSRYGPTVRICQALVRGCSSCQNLFSQFISLFVTAKGQYGNHNYASCNQLCRCKRWSSSSRNQYTQTSRRAVGLPRMGPHGRRGGYAGQCSSFVQFIANQSS